jgi:hypothetical protein
VRGAFANNPAHKPRDFVTRLEGGTQYEHTRLNATDLEMEWPLGIIASAGRPIHLRELLNRRAKENPGVCRA